MTSNREHTVEGFRSRGLVLLGVGALAAFVVAVCAVSTVARVGQPFPGFFVWENLFVPAVGEPDWTGVESGLRYHSWLIAVDGNPVESARELDALLAGRRAGGPVAYGLEKDGERYTVTVRMMEMDVRAWISTLGVYIFEAIALLVLALVIVYLKPGDAAAAALFFFCANLGLWMATSADLFGPYLFRVPYFFFINLVPVTACAVMSYFPLARRRRRWENGALVALAAVGVLLGIASNAAFFGDLTLLRRLDTATHIFVASSSIAAIVFFAWHFFRARSPVVRQRTKVVLFGTTMAFVLPSVVFPLVYARGISFPFNFLAVMIVAFPLGIGYAIAKHDLFNIDRVIKRTLVYSVLSALVIGTYTLTVGTLDYFFESLTPGASRLAEGVLILGLILATAPSHRRIQDFVDRIYDRRHYNYRDVVRSASRAFATILDFDELILKVIHLIDETIQPEFVHVYGVDGEGRASRVGLLDHRSGDARARVVPDASVDPGMDPIGAELRQADLVITEDDRVPGDARRVQASRRLGEIDASLAIPLRLEGRLVGMLVVGFKRAGGHYSFEDVELLRTISDQLAVALENARAYQMIDLLNRDLELNNVALQDANRELREAEAELVQKERLAAIGMVSGAVAHAIRNPLAGIRAAAQLALLDMEGHVAAATVSDVVSETDRLDDRITALLDFSKPFEPDAKRVALGEVAARAVHDTEPKALAREVKIVLEEAAQLPQVRIDPVLFGQAIAELISNAVDASPGRSEVVVRTGHETRAGAAVVWLEVEDSGPGIPEDDSERLFELFFTTKPRGTGFGLATVKKIAEGHGGKILAYNAQGGGGCFRIVLPAQRSETSA